MATMEERVTRLEAINEQIERRLTSLDNRMTSLENRMDGRFTALENRLNVQMQLTVGMWITTMVAVLATLVTILLKT